VKIKPIDLMSLLRFVQSERINKNTAKSVLEMMLQTGNQATTIIAEQGLEQVSDHVEIEELVMRILVENPEQVTAYLNGKETLENWFFGQAMRAAKGKANPLIIKDLLSEKLSKLK
jgi:aspartyl-tRNA(Asn)/glutamyl-tRNA(Gln) amidotransferase subunit B